MSYPAPDSRVHLVVTRWDGKCIIAVDANTNQYIHWLEDDKRWESSWAHLVGKPDLVLLARVGRADGPRGRKFFVVQADVTIAEPESVTRSPLDLFTAQSQESDTSCVAQIESLPRPEKKRKGDCSFTVSLPSEEERILVNTICEKARAKGLVKAKGHYPGQFLKAWLLDQAIKDGLLDL